jgi:iron only hydrogenase large subunit-like protein
MMTNTAHTPGPWTFQRIEASDDNRIVYCLIGPEAELKRTTGVAYAGTYGKTRHLTVTGIRQSDEECEANARLIAAAPDLLVALEAALPFIEAQEGTSDENDVIVDACRAAIAAAKGGA